MVFFGSNSVEVFTMPKELRGGMEGVLGYSVYSFRLEVH